MTLRALSLLVVLAPVAALAAPTYLALGDSVAFGYQDGDLVRSLGVQGYVDDVAMALDARTGVTHDVLNLAVPGETSASFADASEEGGYLNLNYNSTIQFVNGQFVVQRDESQLARLTRAVNAIKATGNTVDAFSFAIGANDILDLTKGGTRTPTASEVQTATQSVFARYASVLGYLRGEFPSALILLPGYYRPVEAGSNEAKVIDPILLGFNQSVSQLAASTPNARYVDFFTPINGREGDLILPGIHPNTEGYDLLGGAAAQAVPEPSALAALGLGAVALLRRRRR